MICPFFFSLHKGKCTLQDEQRPQENVHICDVEIYGSKPGDAFFFSAFVQLSSPWCSSHMGVLCLALLHSTPECYSMHELNGSVIALYLEMLC